MFEVHSRTIEKKKRERGSEKRKKQEKNKKREGCFYASRLIPGGGSSSMYDLPFHLGIYQRNMYIYIFKNKTQNQNIQQDKTLALKIEHTKSAAAVEYGQQKYLAANKPLRAMRRTSLPGESPLPVADQ